jgi:hypothetical protein
MVMTVTDFSNPGIPFNQLMESVAVQYLSKASDTVIQALVPKVAAYLAGQSNEALRNGLNVKWVVDTTFSVTHAFEEEADKLLPCVLAYAPQKTKTYCEEIKKAAESICAQKFIERCVAVLLPDIQNNVLQKTKAAIDAEMTDLPVEHVGAFKFIYLSDRHLKTAEEAFRNDVNKIHSGITSSSEFQSLKSSLCTDISGYVTKVEQQRKDEFMTYTTQEAKKREDEMAAELAALKLTMASEDAEKRIREKQYEIDRLREQHEMELRHQLELGNQKRALDDDVERQKKRNRQLKKDHARNERDELVRREADAQQCLREAAERERKWEEERQAQAERDQATAARLQQLQARIDNPPKKPWWKFW